jgi:methionyl-tRNA formyltransferase
MTFGQKTNLIFFGTEEYSLVTLQTLVERDFRIAAVVTKPDSKKGRGQAYSQPAVKQYARQHGIPVWQPHHLGDIAMDIEALRPVTGILVAYGKIIPQSIIDLFDPGIINLHPSLLPAYRGPSPIEAALLHQDRQTGISIMQLDAKMDAGPVYFQSQLNLNGTETKPDLYSQLFSMGSQALADRLAHIVDGSLPPKPQRDADATYCSLLSKKDAWLDPTTMTASQADAHIRAFLGFPGSRLTLLDHEVIVTKAHVSDTPTDLSVKFADNKHLAIDALKPVGKKEMPARAFLLGRKK